MMLKPLYTALTVTLILTSFVVTPSLLAKPKDPALPAYVLRARTVLVVVDPSAGIDLDDPRANEVARKDVEAALLSWGRFEMVQSGQEADLTIVIRKGSGKLENTTVSDPRQNSRPGDVTATDDAIMLGGQRGQGPGSDRQPGASSPPHPQTEVGNVVVDSFIVYQGKADGGLGGNIGWRYMAKEALRSHNVPAVDEFRKAVAEAEKAAAKQQAKTLPATAPASPQANPPATPQGHP
jgi:hypothetical protein